MRPTASRPLFLFACAAYAVGTWFAFGRATDFEFVWDTLDYLSRAPLAPSFDFVGWAITSLEVSNWHPLTWLSWSLDHWLYGGISTRGFHLSNLVYHWLAGCALLGLLVTIDRTARPDAPPGVRRTFDGVAAVAALIWVCHPQRVEAVVWVAERKELLCALFGFLTAIAYLRARSDGSRRWYVLSVLAYALTAASKPMAVVVPPLLVLLEFYPLACRRGKVATAGSILRATAPFWLMGIGVAWLTLLAQVNTIEDNLHVDLATRIAHSFVQTVTYLRQTLFPVGLSPFYPMERPYPIGPNVALSVTAIVAITALVALVAVRHRRYGPAVAWLGYLVCLVPVIGIVKVGAQAGADRYTYLPIVPLIALSAYGGAALVTRYRRVAPVLGAGGLALAVLLAAMARDYSAAWENRVSIWARAAEAHPRDPLILLNLASAHFSTGDVIAAGQVFDAADEVDAFWQQPRHIVHWAYTKIAAGDFDRAHELLEIGQAWGFLPGCTAFNLAWTDGRRGKGTDALAALDQLSAQPLDPELSELSRRLRAALSADDAERALLEVPFCGREVTLEEERVLRRAAIEGG